MNGAQSSSMDPESASLAAARAPSSAFVSPPMGVVTLSADPLHRVLNLGKQAGIAGAAMLGASTLLHGAFCALAVVLTLWSLSHKPAALPPIEYEVVNEPPPPPPPAPEQEKEEPKAAPKLQPTLAPPPPPAAAKAAAALTAESKKDEPVDFSNTIPVGTADTYGSGGVSSNGTANAAPATTNVSPQGVPGGTGRVAAPPPPPPPTVDRSRSARSVSDNWNCPFPAEADSAQVDDAYVTIQVNVKPDGGPLNVRVLSDPGNGFGREAVRCAMGRRYTSALDRDGNPIAGVTRVRVHFER